jgi:hypothetical protein
MAWYSCFTLFAGLFILVSAQEGTIIDKSKLPACALTCQLLIGAQALCVPPTAPVTNQATYQACFINSNYMLPYRQSNPNGVCDAECPSAADRQQILTWFTGLMNGGVVVTPAGSNNQATSTSSSTASTATSTTSSSKGSKNTHPTWYVVSLGTWWIY